MKRERNVTETQQNMTRTLWKCKKKKLHLEQITVSKKGELKRYDIIDLLERIKKKKRNIDGDEYPNVSETDLHFW